MLCNLGGKLGCRKLRLAGIISLPKSPKLLSLGTSYGVVCQVNYACVLLPWGDVLSHLLAGSKDSTLLFSTNSALSRKGARGVVYTAVCLAHF